MFILIGFRQLLEMLQARFLSSSTREGVVCGGALLRSVLRGTCGEVTGQEGKAKLLSQHVVLAGFKPQLCPTVTPGPQTASE